MLKAFFRNYIKSFEKTWSYDASYMRDVIDANPWSFLKFMLGSQASDRKAAPAEAILAAGLVGTLAEDCGPCTQIGVDMATAQGLSPQIIRAVLDGDEAAMGETAALAYRFARASLAHDLAADALRDEIVRRWGEKALVAISLTLMASRMYPTLKYALGHGKACSKVVVAGVAAPVARLPVAA